MIPLVGHVNELKIRAARNLEAVAKDVIANAGVELDYMFGTMIEIPRACLVADQLADPTNGNAAFFSFGTNDLTQMTFGFSRDDAGKFLVPYIEQKILPTDPVRHHRSGRRGQADADGGGAAPSRCAPTSSWASAASMAANRRA